jgi:hypothetical protein
MLFDKLTSATRNRIFLSMNPLEVLPRTVIIQQGDPEASMFYVLESGACEVLINTDSTPKAVHQYKAGRCASMLPKFGPFECRFEWHIQRWYKRAM